MVVDEYEAFIDWSRQIGEEPSESSYRSCGRTLCSRFRPQPIEDL